MKKVCFIVSHLGSGHEDLVRVLNRNPRCEFHSSGAQYDSPESLERMFKKGHKCGDSSAVYGDVVLFNMNFSQKSLLPVCKFIYLIRPPRPSLNAIMATGLYRESGAASYYRFRLRRICEMAKKTPYAALITWDELARGRAFPAIEDFLGLKTQLATEYEDFIHDDSDSFNERLLNDCQDAYERYYFYLSGLNLTRAM